MKFNIKKEYLKNKEIILYIGFGILTTLVNYTCYFMGTKIFKINYLYSNVIAWLLSVLFAFFSNKFLVFNSMENSRVLKEFLLFISARILSGFLETFLLYIFVGLLKFDDSIVKILVSVLVVISNYYFSKVYVFKKHK